MPFVYVVHRIERERKQIEHWYPLKRYFSHIISGGIECIFYDAVFLLLITVG